MTVTTATHSTVCQALVQVLPMDQSTTLVIQSLLLSPFYTWQTLRHGKASANLYVATQQNRAGTGFEARHSEFLSVCVHARVRAQSL